MILNSIYALASTLGFSILFNIRGKNLFFAALGGGLSWFLYLLLLNFYSSPSFALFSSAVIVSIYSEIMARILKTPVTTLVIIAVIPLVPGNGMYYTMYESITGNINKALNTGFETIISAGAIAVAIVLVSSTIKFLIAKKRLLK